MNLAKLSLVVLGLISVQNSFSSEPKVIRKTLDIGLVYPVNDRFHDTIMSCTSGIELARSLYEADHPDVRIEFHRYDHNEDLDSLVPAIQRAISDGVPAIIGGAISEHSIVINELTRQKNIAWITPTSSHPDAIKGAPFGFRMVASDLWGARALAKFVVEKVRPKSLGVIHNISSPYTDYVSLEFLKGLGNSQQRVVVAKVLKDTMNFDDQIKKFKESGVTHLVMLTHQSDFYRFVPQAEALGFFPTYIGGDGWNSNQYILNDIIPKLAHPERFSALRSLYGNELLSSSFVTRFKTVYEKANGKKPTAWSGIGFDAAWVLFAAMNKAKNSHSASEIASELAKLHHFKTVTDPDFRFDQDHGPVSKAYVYNIKKGGVTIEGILR